MAIIKLCDIGEFKGGISSLNKKKYDTGINFINYMDIYKNYFINDNTKLRKYNASHKEYEKYNVIYGDILLTASSEIPEEISFSTVYLSNKPAIFNGFSKRYRYNKNILQPKFAGYIFRSKIFRTQVKSLVTGYTRFNISQKDLKTIELNIPSLDVQKSIIDIIENFGDEKFKKYSILIRIDSEEKCKKDVRNIIDIIEPLETFLKNLLTMFEKTKQIISTLPITNQTFKLNSILVKEKQTKKNILQISAKVLEKNNPLIYNYEPQNTYKTNSFYVTENTLLFSSIRTYQKKIGLTPYEADINGTLYSYKILKNKLSIFYNLFNDDFWNKCNMLSKGTKMPVLSENDLLNNIELKKLKFEFERIDHIFILLNKLIISINKIKEKLIQILI